MVSLPDGEKKFEDIFIRFAMMHERDRQTDRRTLGDSIYRAYVYASRGKNDDCFTNISLYLRNGNS